MMVIIFRHGKRDTTKKFDSETEKSKIVKYLKNQTKFVWTIKIRGGMMYISIHTHSLRSFKQLRVKGTHCDYYYSYYYAPVLLGY